MKTNNITRTISYSTLKVYSFSKENGMNTNIYSVPGDYSKLKGDELLKDVRETLETEIVKICMVEVIETKKEKRVISLTDFVKYSHVATKEDEENEKEEKEDV